MNGCFWLHSNNHLKNSGVFVIRGRHCVLSGRTKVSSLGNTALTSLGSKAAASANQPNHKAARDPMVGKTVKIIKGGFKGFLAQVIDATADKYTVELLARIKKIVIEKVKCKEVGDKDGSFATKSSGGMGGGLGISLAGAETPHMGGQTPMNGSATPAQNGNETPLHGDSDSAGGFRPRQEDLEDDVNEQGLPREWAANSPMSMGSSVQSPTTAAEWAAIDVRDMRSLSAVRSVSMSQGGFDRSGSHHSDVSGNSYSPSNASSGGSPLSDSGEGNSPRSPVSAGVSERAGGPASAVTFKEWVPGMVMVVTDPAYVGYEGVIEAKADDSGMVRVSIDIQGGARSVTLSHSNLKPAVIQKGDRVYVFKADPGKILPNREGLCAVRLLSSLVSLRLCA